MIAAIGIVGHVARAEQAHKLMDDVGAAYLSLDNGILGCNGNHRKVWRHLYKNFAAHTGWLCVLEDDAIPCEGFLNQLEQALAVTTTAPIVSLYLGRLRPPHLQYIIEPAANRANRENACFLSSRQNLHAVGLAMKTEIVPDMLAGTEDLPIDEAINYWANKNRYRIAYTWPSIIDHADGETLLQHLDGHQRVPGRVAWRFGTRDHWENRIVEMN